MIRSKIYLVIICILIVSVQVDISWGQNKSNNKGVVVKSNPSGAMIYFEGETNFVGVTPFKLHPNFRGIYDIVILKKGYEKRKKTYLFKGNENGTLKLTLSPKTRFKAAFRSIMFPGWGQYYSERKFSGVFMSLVNIGAAIGTVKFIGEYNKAVDHYNEVKDEYLKNGYQYNQAENLWKRVEEKYEIADDKYKDMQTWIYITGGIWLYNILDSIFFFPSFDKEIFHRSIPTISSYNHNGVTKVSLNMSF